MLPAIFDEALFLLATTRILDSDLYTGDSVGGWKLPAFELPSRDWERSLLHQNVGQMSELIGQVEDP
jgi:hypothetical protein